MSKNEGVFRRDEGTTDAEGFIAPSVGLVEHALYFTSAPEVLAKTKQVLDGDRLEIPGAVVVWDETIGRRKGAKAVPGSWWAAAGSVTMSIVVSGEDLEAGSEDIVAEAVLAAINSFSPTLAVSYDGAGLFTLSGKQLGMLHHEDYEEWTIFVVRINAATDFSAAPQDVQDGNARLADVIDVSTLPLGTADTLPNSLSIAIMREVPSSLGLI